MDNKMMTIMMDDGTQEKVEILVCFEFDDTKKEYVVYTKNETDASGNITVYVSRVNRSSGTPKLDTVENDEEWTRIKDVLRELSKNDK